MATLTQEQIVEVARAGGLPGDPWVWSAIAMGESSGRTDVVNPIGCVGLWQVNQPVWVKTHPTWTVAWLQNPVNNAKAAAVVYASQGFKAWEAYTGPDGTGSDGPWKQYYKGSGPVNEKPTQTAAGFWYDPFEDWWNKLLGDPKRGPGSPGWNDDPLDIVPDTPTLGLGDVATGVGTIAEAVTKTARWLGKSSNWVRVGYVAGGAVLIVTGLQIVAKPVTAGAAPALRIAKKATKRVIT